VSSDAPSPPVTGDATVDAALRAVADAATTPPGEQVPVLRAAQTALQEWLDRTARAV